MEKCWLCPRTFSGRTELVAHLISRDHKRQSVICPWCGEKKTFTRVADLVVHTQKKHFIEANILPKTFLTARNCFYFALYPEDYSKIHQPETWGSINATEARRLVLRLFDGQPDSSERRDKWRWRWRLAKKRQEEEKENIEKATAEMNGEKEREQKLNTEEKDSFEDKNIVRQEREVKTEEKSRGREECVKETVIVKDRKYKERDERNNMDNMQFEEEAKEKVNVTPKVLKNNSKCNDMPLDLTMKDITVTNKRKVDIKENDTNEPGDKQIKRLCKEKVDEIEKGDTEQRTVNNSKRTVRFKIRRLSETSDEETEDSDKSKSENCTLDTETYTATPLVMMTAQEETQKATEVLERELKQDCCELPIVAEMLKENNPDLQVQTLPQRKLSIKLTNGGNIRRAIEKSIITNQEKKQSINETSDTQVTDKEDTATNDTLQTADGTEDSTKYLDTDNNSTKYTESDVNNNYTKNAPDMTVTTYQEKAIDLLKVGAMPIVPPGRRDWKERNPTTFCINGCSFAWPPESWSNMSADRKLMAWEHTAFQLQYLAEGIISPNASRNYILDTYNFLALPGSGKPYQESTEQDATLARFHTYKMLQEIAKGKQPSVAEMSIIDTVMKIRVDSNLTRFLKALDVPLRML